ncbi:DUF4375 domain-containing protein [Paenibacillus sp. BR2-3]|uniref:DMP19 family protein n=1 Tax=Paenibacillus sp. BR2-3 TaxID=3048494 RepID=UPI0039778D1A
MKKVLVLGCAGSGKSTFSELLGKNQGLPVVHLDSLYWKPGWQASSAEEWDLVIEKLIHKDKYVLDGNYSRTLKVRLKESDTIFYLDFPRYLCLYRIFKRRILNHGRVRSDMAEGTKRIYSWYNTRVLIDSVNDGGLISFYYNTGADYLIETMEDLHRIKADKVIKLLLKVNKLFPEGNVPTDIDERNEIISSWDDEETDSKLEKIDDQFYELEEDLEKRIEPVIKQLMNNY